MGLFNRSSGKGEGSRGINDCYRCRRSIGDGGMANTASVFSSGVFSNMTYECKSCGKRYCLDCMSALKNSGGVCDACGGQIGW